jgi:hypothetical protein
MNSEIWTLPFEVQLVLASGYAAYFLSYIGIREHHKTVEIVFIVFVYGLITKLSFGFFQTAIPTLFDENSHIGHIFSRNISFVLSAILAFTLTVLTGYLWRKFGRKFVRSHLRKSDYSWSNDDPTSWRTITSSTDFWFTQVSVQMKDGTWLECRDTNQYKDHPHGPMTLGQNGDIALYVTDITQPNDTEAVAETNVIDTDWGSRLKYVPSGEIKSITFRLKKKTSPS